MGTRHLVAVVLDGKPKIAQYGQWDGYPEGQGVTVLEFLRHQTKRNKLGIFKKKCRRLTFITDEEAKALAEQFKENWSRHLPSLSRDTGAKILEMVAASGSAIPLRSEWDFAADSLFCEWAYIVDFDKGCLEVYKGFNHSPLGPEDRFHSMPLNDPKGGEQYYPVRIAKTFPLDSLPTKRAFLKALEEKDEVVA